MSTGNLGLSPAWGAYHVTLAKPPSSFWVPGFASMDNRIGLEQSSLFQCSDSYQSDLSMKGRNTLFFLSSWVNYPLSWHKPGFLFGLAHSAELWMDLWEQNPCALEMLWKGPEHSLQGLMLKLQYFGHLMLTHWKSLWYWERLKAKGNEGNRGWNGWMPSLIHWAWVWANSGRQWRTGKPGVLQSMGSQRVGHDLATEQQDHL